MKTYQLIITSGQSDITLSLPYGSMNFKNGELVPESAFTKNYPDLFHFIKDDSPEENIQEKLEVVKLFEKSIQPEKIKLETPKKKAGRPKKSFNSKGK